MFDTICTLPLSSDLFAQAIHPTEPAVAIGLASGHVAYLSLPPVSTDDDDAASAKSDGRGSVDTVWKTRRHKGSCRCLAFSHDGAILFSAGTDGLLKAAHSETGKVIAKVAISLDDQGKLDAPSALHVLSPQTLLLATDSGALHMYDLRDPASSVSHPDKPLFTTGQPSVTHHPHTDYISSITPLPPSRTSTSGFSKQWISAGGTTLALTDLRRGVLVKSEDQEEILLSSLLVSGFPHKKASGSTGEKILVGGGDGVLTLWEKGQWDDQDERIIVSREGETLDVLALLPEGVGSGGKMVAVGMGDGRIRIVRLGMNKAVAEVQHDEVEGVTGLGFDIGGRMISGGGQTLKIWQEAVEAEEPEEVEDGPAVKRALDSDDDEEDVGEEPESSAEEEKPRKRRKKRKKGKAPAPTATNGASFAGLD